MKLDYGLLENELIDAFKANTVWILATSSNGKTTARAISIISFGTIVYFQTSNQSEKYLQLIVNPNVALSFSNASVEAIAKDVGNWNQPQNAEIMRKYIEVHKSSFERYGEREDEVVIQLTPIRAKFWKYLEGKPNVDSLLFNEEEATSATSLKFRIV